MQCLPLPTPQVGILSSLPYLGRFVGAQVFGIISSFLRRRDLLSVLSLQRLNVAISFLGPAAGRSVSAGRER